MFAMHKPCGSSSHGKRLAVAVTLLLATATSALAQKTGYTPDEYPIYSVDLFAGWQHFLVDNRDSARTFRIDSGFAFGFRVTEDFWRYVGIEESFMPAFNNLIFYPVGLTGSVSANQRDYTLSISPVIYFTPREAKVRPFVTVGPGYTWYRPATSWATTVTGFVPPVYPLTDQTGPSLIYGGGVKYNASRRVGLRADFRMLRTGGHEFGVPQFSTGTGSIYVMSHNSENAWSATGGVTFRFGFRGGAAPPPPPPPPPPPAPVAHISITGVSGAHDVCPGEDVHLEVAAAGWLTNQTPTYQWMVDGQPAAGATSSGFNMSTLNSGTHSITVTVSAPGSSETSNPVSVRVKNYAPPTVRFTLSRTTIAFGDKLPLDATAAPSECGGSVSIRYTASDGSISGNVFDSSSMAFDPSNRLKQQTKVVHLTATATDQKGGTGSASADLTVTLSAQARRLDDIIFPNMSARVNNCAKRLLLEQLTPMLRDDPNATVVLIGHRDERERGRAGAQLDRQRALNAAAVISAGQGICPMLELSRIKIGWVGTEQTSTPRPLMCGASTEVKERGGSAIRANDQRAQFRRVEVWIIPGGAAMPPEITGLQTLPEADIKKLGCPK